MLMFWHLIGAPETMDVSGPSGQQPTSQTDQSATAVSERGSAGADQKGMAAKKEDAGLGKQVASLGAIDATLRVEGTTAPSGGGGGKWLKFNDINVSVVPWEDVERESFGDSRNTSAYCLIYVADDGSWEEHGEIVAAVITYVSTYMQLACKIASLNAKDSK